MGVHRHNTNHISQKFNKNANFSNYLLIVDDYYNIWKLYEMKNITTEEVMNKLNMFQARLWKVDKCFCLYMERIQTDSNTQFTSK